MTITTLNELNVRIKFMVVVFKARAVMPLSTQLILCNAIWQKFLAASSIASGAKIAHFKIDIASQK